MENWVIVLISNEPYINKALNSIKEIRSVGQWVDDIVFYLDAGCFIHDSLERFKKSCKPTNCIYAHSDAYPYINNWYLKRQFVIDIFDNIDDKNDFINNYSMYFDKDYFQSTMFIYDTKIIEDDTVEKLFKLNEKYPIAFRMDQGIFNLYFNCDKNLWKQIPIKDDKGFLYDFNKRPGYQHKDYAILKRYNI